MITYALIRKNVLILNSLIHHLVAIKMTFPKAKDKPIYDKISEYFANAADLGGGRQKSHIEAEERKKKQSQKASKASSIELNGSFSSNSEKSDNCDPLWKSPTKQRKSSEHFEESDFSDFDRNDSSDISSYDLD